MNVVAAQVLTMTGLFVAMVTCCLIPYFLINKRKAGQGFQPGNKYEVVISFANCFSGGVFVATFFVGLLPHVREQFIEILAASSFETNFPVTEFVVFTGFFIALLIEHVTILCQQKRKNKKGVRVDCASEGHVLHETGSQNSAKNVDGVPNNDADKEVASEDEIDEHEHVISENHQHHGHSHDISSIIEHEHGAGGSHHRDTGVRFYMLVLSLSVHSIFEGMALGLQTRISDLINLFVGVIIHECLVAFAMGVSLSKIKPSLGIMLRFSVLFSIMIPIGQAFGLLVGNQESFSGQVIGAVLQGIAAGTFIHVTFLEVIPAELYHKKYILFKILFIFLGFLLIVGCIYALDNSHPHHHPPSSDSHSFNNSEDIHHDHRR